MKTTFQRIVIGFETGEVAVMSFITRGRGPLPPGAKWLGDDPSFGLWERPATDENVIEELSRFALSDGRKIVSWRCAAESEIPTDRSYRDAWSLAGDGKIGHDMPRARELHREKLRRARVGALAALDVEASRADEEGDPGKKADVARRKQALRDAPAHPDIQAATTIEELKAVKLGLLP